MEILRRLDLFPARFLLEKAERPAAAPGDRGAVQFRSGSVIAPHVNPHIICE
jgi:hypothetical protein